jgi:hypothetical protein
MNDVDLIVMIMVVIVTIMFIWMMGNKAAAATATPAAQSFTVNPPPINVATGKPTSRFYGSSNPINSYVEKLQKEGTYDTYKSGLVSIADAREELLTVQGVLNPSEVTQHKTYYQSNMGKYPFQIVGDVHEMRTTKSPYVAGTRSMRAVDIGTDESQVPDKLERTVRPY